MMESRSILDQRPEELAGAHDAADALQSLLQVVQLTPDQESAITYAIAFWTVQAIERPDDAQTLAVLDRLCAAAVRRAATDAPQGVFEARMATIRSLLENKRLAIKGRESGRAKRLLRTQAILQVLEGGELTQSKLSKQLGLTAGRVSQLLSVLEEGQLVRRRRQGRESFVSRVHSSPTANVTTIASSFSGRTVRPMLAFQEAA